ncbi:hypothetical protein ACHQM5_016637 [Ranunculus cassubicifolius]
MSQPLYHVQILSDDDDDDEEQLPPLSKKRKSDEFAAVNLVILDDDPTPKKSISILSTPSHVSDTPMSDNPFNSGFSINKCTTRFSSDPNIIRSLPTSAFDIEAKNSAGGSSLICLESDNESAGDNRGIEMTEREHISSACDFGDNAMLAECFTEYVNSKVFSQDDEEIVTTKQVEFAVNQTHKLVESDEEHCHERDVTKAKKRKTKEEQIRLAEEKKLKREQEKLQRKALKDEAAEAKRLQKEQQKWEKGKFALKSIVAEIDAKVVQLGSIGGPLLSRFAEKGISFRITSNPIERSILWTMSVPEEISEMSSKEKEILYVLLVYEADEFCNLVNNESLMGHASGVQSRYPSHTICYLTNKLMAYINKREQAQYKNQSNNNIWKRPPVEEALSKLATDYTRVHSRQCRDEAEVADHVVGLTCALANCHFRKKLSRLSINANGAVVPKDFIDRSLIKKNVWLKALVAIPKVQPRFAVAIWKKYPTMKSLLSVYMDPSKSIHEKEFLLENLPTESLLAKEDRRVGPVCSKRVYRILMAKNGNIKTDDVELGADFFT